MRRHADHSGASTRLPHPRALPFLIHLLRTGWLFLLLLQPACSAWKDSITEPLNLPAPRMAADSVGLEITFVRVPSGMTDTNQQIWQQIDEQCIDPLSRMHLNRNGFRAGLVGDQLPDALRRLLDEQNQQQAIDQLVSSESDVLTKHRHIQSRAGQRNEIVASPILPQLVVLKASKSGSLEGVTYQNAQCILAARTFPQNDGSVKLELIPELHHGEPQSQWIAGEGTFHFLSGKKREVYSDLKTELTLSPGQSVVLSSTLDIKGLGENFFLESGRGASQLKYFLIRLSQTQRDELFDQRPSAKSLQATP